MNTRVRDAFPSLPPSALFVEVRCASRGNSAKRRADSLARRRFSTSFSTDKKPSLTLGVTYRTGNGIDAARSSDLSLSVLFLKMRKKNETDFETRRAKRSLVRLNLLSDLS